jgi:hypothetical protein
VRLWAVGGARDSCNVVHCFVAHVLKDDWVSQAEHEEKLLQPEYMHLSIQLWERQRQALARASRAAVATASQARRAAEEMLPKVRKGQTWRTPSALCAYCVDVHG